MHPRGAELGTVVPLASTRRPTRGEPSTVATIEECERVLQDLADRLAAVDEGARRKHLPDRSLELKLLDLDTSFRGRIHDGEVLDIVEQRDGPKPNIRMVTTSDDLVALANGDLKFAAAWASGRVRLDASIRDLLRLRSFTNNRPAQKPR